LCQSHHGTRIQPTVSSPYLFFNSNFCYISKWALLQFFIIKFVLWWWLEAFKEHASPEFLVLSHYNTLNYKIAKPWSEFQFLIEVGNIQQCFNDHCFKGFKFYNLLIAPIKPKKIFNNWVMGNELEIIKNQS
jgi:hypothetical protein